MNVPLIAILLFAGLVRSFYLFSPFVRIEEWGMAQFSVYAANYHKFGYWTEGLFPLYGRVGTLDFPYPNHPPLASILLGLWTGLVGNTEVAARILSILIQLGSVTGMYFLGRRFFNERIGRWSAVVFAALPQSAYMGHYYTMEVPQLFFSIWAVYFICSWQETESYRDYGLAVASLVLGNASDYYPYFFSPAIGLWTLYFLKQGKSKGRVAAWAFLTFLGPLCFLSQLAYLYSLGWAKTLLVNGASKYSNPWVIWSTSDYYQSLARRLFLDSGIVPGVAMLIAPHWSKEWNRTQSILISLLYCLPITDAIVSAVAVQRHYYRTHNFLPILALTAALLLVRLKKKHLVAVFALFVPISIYTLHRYYEVLRPKTPEIAAEIRRLTTDRDILVGLPPDLTYYVGRTAVVPYFFLWKHGELNKGPNALFEKLHPLAQQKGYDRIILFQRHLLQTPNPQINWSKAFDGVPNLKRVTKPESDPQVWQFVP